ncbi:hypothetical protein P9112_005982 [Eukaryota sp. TZLM1-RC]
MEDDWEAVQVDEYGVSNTTSKKPQPEEEDSDIPDDWELSEEEEEEVVKATHEEEADYESTRKLFGEVGVRATGDPNDAISGFNPISAADFETLGTAIGKKCLAYHKDSLNFDTLVKTMLNVALTKLDSEAVRRIAGFVSTIANEKLAAEKAAKGGKKKKSKKVSLKKEKVNNPIDVLDYEEGADYIEDDYGFM